MKVFDRYFALNPGIRQPDFDNAPAVAVVIPVLDDPDVFLCLDSLARCRCRLGNMGVIVVVNHSEEASPDIRESNRQLAARLRNYSHPALREGRLSLSVLEAFDLPARSAGVGTARKIGMDAASLWFYRAGRPEAPILSLDADTLVEPSYTDVILSIFQRKPIAGLSIAYAHRLEECGPEALEAMVRYELYLRYYHLALKYTGHPHAFACIGSAFAVRVSDYVAQGGMNRRQAGEDFYFIQKLVATGRYGETAETRVYPSPRFSCRTPFGTGRSLRQIVEAGGSYPVYDFNAFKALKPFFAGIEGLYRTDADVLRRHFQIQDAGLQEYLAGADMAGAVMESAANAASSRQFVRRFFEHFNAFRVLKYLNAVHVSRYVRKDISAAAEDFFREMGYPFSGNLRKDLDFLRNMG